MSVKQKFDRVTATVTHALGSPAALSIAVAIVAIWALSGPLFGFSDTWQLVINTGTTVVTFLMVFVIQHAQNRDTKAVHAKLDELIHALGPARDEVINAETEPEEVVDGRIAELRAGATPPPTLEHLAEQLQGLQVVDEGIDPPDPTAGTRTAA